MVLKGISINLPKNKVVALLGANGAGKTTVLRAISGLLDIQNGKITKGEVIYDEKNITNSNPSEIVKMGISQVLEGRRIFSEITVLENLKLGAHTNTQNFEKNVGYFTCHFRHMTSFFILSDVCCAIFDPNY